AEHQAQAEPAQQRPRPRRDGHPAHRSAARHFHRGHRTSRRPSPTGRRGAPTSRCVTMTATAGPRARDDSRRCRTTGRRQTFEWRVMSNLSAAGQRRIEVSLLVAFIDLAGFALQSTRVADDEIAEVIDDYYATVAEHVTAAGGRVVKYM